MNAWVTAAGAQLAAAPWPAREPGATEVVVRVLACAVSPRELAAIGGAAPLGRAPGGGVIGEIVRAGAEAGPVGARVIVPPWLACFECDLCRRARGVVCPRGRELGIDVDGGFAPEIVVPARPLLPFLGALALPAGAPSAVALAALARDGALAYATYARLGAGPGETVVVSGMTGVGLLLLDILRAKGISAIALDFDETRLAHAQGRAKLVADPRAELPRAELGALPRLVETTGRPEAVAAALAMLPDAGMLALVGRPTQDGAAIQLDPAALAARDQSIIGIAGCHADLYPELAALALRGDLDLAGVTSAVPAASAPALIQAMREGRSPGVIPVLDWDAH